MHSSDSAGGLAANRAIFTWVAIGLLAYLVLPWYALQDRNGLTVIAQVFGGDDTANGVVQAARHGRSWLWVGLVGLAVAAGAASMRPGKPQGALLAAAGLLGGLGLAASGFLIGAKGWSHEWLTAVAGPLASNQFGIGWGGFVALAALVVLTAFGFARQGYFKGDLFIAAAVAACGVLLAVFILFPVLKALSSAFFNEEGHFAITALWDRVASDRNFGLQCVVGGVRCGVAWNTLFLGLMAAASTTLLGTLMALMAERGSKRFNRPFNLLAMLPIITPPFVVGLGLILLFG
ncbi:MAG: iron ABC transporter permease, partial [Ramlibacter sp.]